MAFNPKERKNVAVTKGDEHAYFAPKDQTRPATAPNNYTPRVGKEYFADDYRINVPGSGTSRPKAPASAAISQATSPVDTPSTGTVTKKTFDYGAYQPSDAVKQAESFLQQQMTQKPGAYQSPWQPQLDDTIRMIMERDKFSYDLQGDPLYQQYKNQYISQGQMAMMDTIGQAAAMTGGYGNSYAQTAGQQAYQGHLQQLNDRIPELYQLALDKYQMEGQDLYNRYAMLGEQDARDYGRYRDNVGDWNAEMDRAQDRYYTERDYDYGRYQDDRNFRYGMYQQERGDELDAANTAAQFGDYSKLAAYYGWTPEYMDGLTKPKSSSSGGASRVHETESTELPIEATEDPTDKRHEEIENWVASSLANANGPSFSLDKLIAGSNFLKTDEERAYAADVGKYFAGIR